MDGEELGLLDGSGTEEVEVESGAGVVEEAVEEEVQGSDGEPEGGGRQGAREERVEDGDEADQGRTDRSALPVKLRKAIRELAAANPQFAKAYPRLEKEVTGALFAKNAVDRLGGVQRFQEFSDLMEAHGGAEGVASMAEEVERGRALERGFEQGDPATIDAWAKEYPNGFKASIGTALERLEAMDQARYDQEISAPMWKTLDRCGVISTFNALEPLLAGNEGAIKQFNLIKGFLSDLRNLAVKAKSPDPLKADRERLEADRVEFASERQKHFYGSVRADVNGQIMAQMNRLIRNELAGARIDQNVANRLRKEINAELARSVNTAPGYQERYKAVISGGDKDRAVRFIVQNATAKLPSVVKQLVREFNLKGAAKTAGGNGLRRVVRQGAGPGGSQSVGRPKVDEVDFTKTDKASWLTMRTHGQAFLKNGKIAKW